MDVVLYYQRDVKIAGTQNANYNIMQSKYGEEFILVPRASVSAPTSVPETRSAAVVAAQSTSAVSSSSVTTSPTRSTLSMALSKVPLTGDHALTTTLNAYYEDAVPSAAALDYKFNLYCDLPAEFASFKALYEQYKCLSIRLETWTGGITTMNNVLGNTNAGPLVENVSRSPYVTAPTMQQLLDQPGAHFLDYGFHGNHFITTYKPQGCYVPDTGSSPDNFVHSSGWQETANVAKHIWGCWLQQSSATNPISTASGKYIIRRMTFVVAFRRRRQT